MEYEKLRTSILVFFSPSFPKIKKNKTLFSIPGPANRTTRPDRRALRVLGGRLRPGPARDVINIRRGEGLLRALVLHAEEPPRRRRLRRGHQGQEQVRVLGVL